MTQIPKDEPSKEKFRMLLFQLGEMLNDPPIVINFLDWRETIEDLMEEIEELSPFAFGRLDDLVTEALRRAGTHVEDLDSDAAPGQIEKSEHEYFAQVAFVASEINDLKSY